MPKRERLRVQKGRRPKDAESKRWAFKDSEKLWLKEKRISQIRTLGQLHYQKKSARAAEKNRWKEP
jgi:hypothetical protein